MDDDIFVYITDLPEGVHEAVTPCADGYTVYLDSGLWKSDRIKAYEHALRHIKNLDFEKCDVQEIEGRTHYA